MTLHSDLIETFKGWKASADQLIVELESLAPGEMDSELCMLVQTAFDRLFYKDSLFVSFVVQCAAKECFELENDWHRLPMGLDSHFEERRAILIKKLALISRVLVKQIDIFETGQFTREEPENHGL